MGICLFYNELQQKRVGLLMASAVFEGASIGPLIELAIDFDPRYVQCYIHIFSRL